MRSHPALWDIRVAVEFQQFGPHPVVVCYIPSATGTANKDQGKGGEGDRFIQFHGWFPRWLRRSMYLLMPQGVEIFAPEMFDSVLAYSLCRPAGALKVTSKEEQEGQGPSWLRSICHR